MAYKYTADKLRSLSPEQRFDLFARAKKAGGPEGQEIIDMLVSNDLLVQPGGGYPREHPIIREMEEVICSEAGRTAARAAADRGEPAIADVDPLLQERLGSKYGLRDTTSWAGTIVAEEMRRMGYAKIADNRPLPTNCRAKTAALFGPRSAGLNGTVRVTEGGDLTEPTGEVWDADQGRI